MLCYLSLMSYPWRPSSFYLCCVIFPNCPNRASNTDRLAIFLSGTQGFLSSRFVALPSFLYSIPGCPLLSFVKPTTQMTQNLSPLKLSFLTVTLLRLQIASSVDSQCSMVKNKGHSPVQANLEFRFIISSASQFSDP